MNRVGPAGAFRNATVEPLEDVDEEAEEALERCDSARLASERRPPLRLGGEEGAEVWSTSLQRRYSVASEAFGGAKYALTLLLWGAVLGIG